MPTAATTVNAINPARARLPIGEPLAAENGHEPRARRSSSMTTRTTRNNAKISGRRLSAMSAWRVNAADRGTLWRSACPLPIASCTLMPATIRSRERASHSARATRAEHDIAIAPIPTKGINTTGVCTSNGCAGRPNSFEMSMRATVRTAASQLTVGQVENFRRTPARGRLVDTPNLRVNEAALTGEAVPVDEAVAAGSDAAGAPGGRLPCRLGTFGPDVRRSRRSSSGQANFALQIERYP